MDNHLTRLSPPINVDISNPYVDVDRGLFIILDKTSLCYARVKEATFVTHGPTLSPGILKYKLETFTTCPVTQEDFSNGTIDPVEYETITVGSKTAPILIEYWAKTNHFQKKSTGTAFTQLEQEVLNAVKMTGESYTGVLMNGTDRSIRTEVTYGTSDTTPLTMLTYSIVITEEGTADVTVTVPVEQVDPLFDPVLYIRGL